MLGRKSKYEMGRLPKGTYSFESQGAVENRTLWRSIIHRVTIISWKHLDST